ncbi:MAG: ATP-binding protein [Vicingaceae bacterium]
MRIAITGPESTGKTTLATALSLELGLPLSNEYARLFLEINDGTYTEPDLVFMAKEQYLLNDKLDTGCGIIADTEMMVFVVWSQVKYGRCSEKIIELFKGQRFDHYLLCYPDLPWENDMLRESPLFEDRIALFNEYRSQFEKARLPYHVVKGNGLKRLANALTAISHH